MRSNCLLIHSRGVDKILSMQEHIQWGRAFLQRFHEETPWQLPFSVNGTTRRHGNLKVEKDFSNFEEMLKLALSDYRKDGFRNVGNPDVNDLLPVSYSSTGFRLSCSDGYGIKKSRDRCSLSMGSPAYSEGIGALREFAFSCYDFKPGGINAPWVATGMIGHVIEVLKESVVYCVDLTYTTERLVLACIENDLEAKYDVYMKGGPIIGPITYFGNPAVIDVLKDEPDMQPYGDGLLLRLTDDIANAERPEIVARLHAIRCKLLDAGIKSLEHGINRADWGCDGSSVLQGEPERWERTPKD